MIAAGEFLEWAEVFGNYYGTALAALAHARSLDKDLLLDIDVQGAVQIMQRLHEAVSIFIMPPSPQVLEMRLRNRSEAEHMTAEAVIERRLQEAQKELDRIAQYRYAIVNDVLDQAVAELRAIVPHRARASATASLPLPKAAAPTPATPASKMPWQASRKPEEIPSETHALHSERSEEPPQLSLFVPACTAISPPILHHATCTFVQTPSAMRYANHSSPQLKRKRTRGELHGPDRKRL